MPIQNLPDRRSYSDRSALLCAKLSSWSYLDFDKERKTLERKLKRAGLKLIDTVSKEKTLKTLKPVGLIDTQAILVESEDGSTTFIAFRGSEPKDLTDWYTDAQIKMKDVEPGIELHKGFFNAYRLVNSQIRRWLEQSSDNPVFLCGHSLGGALAIVTAAMNRDLPAASCYTFGGPRVGALDATLIKTPIYRVANALDPVPDLPPATFFISKYRHIGDEYKLHDGGIAPEIINGDSVVDQITENVREAGAVLKNFFRSRLQEGVTDALKAKVAAHSSELYVKRLKIIADARN